MDDFVFGPLPAQDPLPIVIGGRAEAALRRVGAMADGYQSSATGPDAYAGRIPVIAAAAEAAGRPMPSLAARVSVRFGAGDPGGYTMHGEPAEIAAEIGKFAALGVTHLALAFGSTSAAEIVERVERFHADVIPLVSHGLA